MEKQLQVFIVSQFNASAQLLQATGASSAEQISRVGELLAQQLAAGRKLLLFGNGGSAADAQHFAAELMGRYKRERQGIPALALASDSSLVTAIGNDYGFETIFSRQVEALAQPGDVAIGFTTSGRSKNVVAGLISARKAGAHTVALTGPDSSHLGPTADEVISVQSSETARIQEVHAVVIHILCDIIEESLSK